MEEAGQCRLLAGTAAFLAQGVLALLAFASLIVKRQRERPQRPVLVWGLDVSKQVVSMLAAHTCGMLIAIIAHHASASSSECAWYFVAYTFDTTLGLLLTLAFHKAVLKLAKCWKKRYGSKAVASGSGGGCDAGSPPAGGAEAGSSSSHAPLEEHWYDIVALCGQYGDPPSLYKWFLQMAEWTLCVVAARAVCGTLVVLLGTVLIHIAQGLDGAFAGHPTLLLFFVMICCPLCMNMIQVLIQDAILKWKRSGPSPSLSKGEESPMHQERELLLEGVPRSGV